MSRMEQEDRRTALDVELARVRQIDGGLEAANIFETLHVTLQAAKVMTRQVFGSTSPELVMAVYDRFLKIWQTIPAGGAKRDKALDEGEASFEED